MHCQHISPLIIFGRVMLHHCKICVYLDALVGMPYQKQKLRKLDSRFRAAIFIGYSEQSKAYKLLVLEQGRIIVSRDVIFDEHCFRDFKKNSGPFV